MLPEKIVQNIQLSSFEYMYKSAGTTQLQAGQ